jgi:hypothetical protein
MLLFISMLDYTRATELTPEVEASINDAFAYHSPTSAQVEAMQAVRAALATASRVIVEHAPPCADRTVALREITNAGMNTNRAIVLGSKI